MRVGANPPVTSVRTQRLWDDPKCYKADMSVQYKPAESKDASSKMETDNISIACLENTVNINDLVMGSTSEKMVTLMLLIIGIQMCIE